jgi:hypothetical protein
MLKAVQITSNANKGSLIQGLAEVRTDALAKALLYKKQNRLTEDVAKVPEPGSTAPTSTEFNKHAAPEVEAFTRRGRAEQNSQMLPET